MVLLLALQLQAAAQSLLINEFVYNPDGSDDGLEWIEVCNSGSSAIDIDGWRI